MEKQQHTNGTVGVTMFFQSMGYHKSVFTFQKAHVKLTSP
jgi:hypothetical protein